jgi:hypothetical protein
VRDEIEKQNLTDDVTHNWQQVSQKIIVPSEETMEDFINVDTDAVIQEATDDDNCEHHHRTEEKNSSNKEKEHANEEVH